MRRRCGRHIAILVFAAVMCLAALYQTKASASEPERLILDEFHARFEQAFKQGERSTLKALAVQHRDLLRPLVDLLLADFLKKSLQSDVKETGKALALATAVARKARELSHDSFPIRQVKRYRCWSRNEIILKHKADSYLREANSAFDEGRYGDVLVPAQSALELYSALGDEAGEGDALHFLGQAERRLANYPAALAWHERARALAGRSDDRLRQGRTLIDLGDVYERKKDQERAIEFYRQALRLLKVPEEWQEATRALRQLGDVYVATGKFESAYGAYSQALSHAEQASDAVRMAELNDYLGYCYRSLGDFANAIEHYRRALENAAGITGDERRSRARSRSLNHLGIATAKLAEVALIEKDRTQAVEWYRQALRYEGEALELSVRTQDRWRQGYVLRALSLIHHDLGSILTGNEALEEYHKSLVRADQAHSLALLMKEKEWEGLALHHRALALTLLGRESEGLATFQQALSLWERIGDLKSMGYAHRFVARQFHEAKGRLPEALVSYDRALSNFQKIGDTVSEACTMTDKARIYGAQGRKEQAAALYGEGLAKLESVRANAGFLEFKKAFMGKVYDRYEEATLFMLENGFRDRAFKYAESIKARMFLDQLAEGRVELDKGIDPDLKKVRDQLENSLSTVGNRIADEYRKSLPDERVIARLRVEQERLATELDRLRKQIRMKNPLYASVEYPEPITVSELQAKVLKSDEVLFEYFVSTKGIFCFVITHGRYEVVKLAMDEEGLGRRVEALLENVEAGPQRGEGFDRAVANELYKILLKPFEWAMTGKTLIIVPDGILTRLPFEILVIMDDDRSYLLEKHAVKYVQSASVLGTLRAQYEHDIGRSHDAFIGFGDPVYDYENFKAGKPEQEGTLAGGEEASGRLARTRYVRVGGRLSRLEASGDEVKAIKRIFREKNREEETLLRVEAREGRAKSREMERYDYIHFAMHGILAPRFQAIAFSQIPNDKEDGMLTLGEIMNVRYNARLVVLSACQTGLGRIERSEGVTGLTRAVMYAGSPVAVVSLWSVDDEGTRELMVRFYDNMISKEVPKAEALRAAKLEMLKTRYRNPFFWSVFVMYGE
jgi:CHAT domain-containing protein/tetratricopeptide (TPR) repeat protein